MKPVKAYLIDSRARVVREISIVSRDEIQRLLDAAPDSPGFSAVALNDDEHHPTPDVIMLPTKFNKDAGWFMFPACPVPIGGNGVVIGATAGETDGDVCEGEAREAPTMTLEAIEKQIVWVARNPDYDEIGPEKGAAFEVVGGKDIPGFMAAYEANIHKSQNVDYQRRYLN